MPGPLTIFDGLRALLQRADEDDVKPTERFVVSADRVGDELRLRAQTRTGSGVSLWSTSYSAAAMEKLVTASTAFGDAVSALQAVATAIEHPNEQQRQGARINVSDDGQTISLIVRVNRKDAVTFSLAYSDDEPTSEWDLLCSVLERRVAIDKAMGELAEARNKSRDLERRLNQAQVEVLRAPSGSGSQWAAPSESGGGRLAATQTSVKEKNIRAGAVKRRVIGGGKKRGALAFDDESSTDDEVPKKVKAEP